MYNFHLRSIKLFISFIVSIHHLNIAISWKHRLIIFLHRCNSLNASAFDFYLTHMLCCPSYPSPPSLLSRDIYIFLAAETGSSEFIFHSCALFPGHFPIGCQSEVRWMFGHLDSDNDGRLSLSELYGLEHDQNEPCLKPFLDGCDTDR